MIGMIGPLVLIPGRLPYVHMCHPRVLSCPLIPSLIFQVDLLAREDVRTPPMANMVSLAEPAALGSITLIAVYLVCVAVQYI